MKANEHCENCSFWHYAGSTTTDGWKEGHCRKHAPVLRRTTVVEDKPRSQWPPTLGYQTCGDFVPEKEEGAAP